MIDGITGKSAQADRVALGALAGGQRALMEWVTEVTESSAVTNLTLARVTRHVVDTRRQLAQVDAVGQRNTESMRLLAELLGEALSQVDNRLAELERRLDWIERRQDILELRFKAQESFELSVGAWASGQTYGDLPWLCQIALLAWEVATGPAGQVEYLTGDRGYRDKLINSILGHDWTRRAIPAPFTVSGLLDETAIRLHTAERQLLIAELLGSGLTGRLATPTLPLCAALMTALELAAIPDGRPEHPGKIALELVRLRHGWLDGSAEPIGFVRRIVNEQADAAHVLRADLKNDDDG
ncbi:hypothetical protein [Microbispora sp. H10836]|uniref:hypothetical protein n=1 Tax=Microbispora sp. H10836 TaxID=2729106 RepID=UPI001475F1CF|nr:hypothetical protein [Microbispora sp. H10836]